MPKAKCHCRDRINLYTTKAIVINPLHVEYATNILPAHGTLNSTQPTTILYAINVIYGINLAVLLEQLGRHSLSTLCVIAPNKLDIASLALFLWQCLDVLQEVFIGHFRNVTRLT